MGGDGVAARRGPDPRIGIAPGPANGFTLDVIACLERFGDLMDWAMLILNPFEPWPGELALRACAAKEVAVMARVVDYGGIFWDDVRPGHGFAPKDHRLHRPDGWIEAGVGKLEAARPIAEKHGLTPLQLAAQWDLAHVPVACVVPTLIQEPGGRAVEAKRAELAAHPAPRRAGSGRGRGDQRSATTRTAWASRARRPITTATSWRTAGRWRPSSIAAGARWGVDAQLDLAANV